MELAEYATEFEAAQAAYEKSLDRLSGLWAEELAAIRKAVDAVERGLDTHTAMKNLDIARTERLNWETIYNGHWGAAREARQCLYQALRTKQKWS